MRSRITSRAASWAIAAVVFVACAVYIAATFRWSDVAEVLRSVDAVQFLGVGGATVLLFCLLRSLRWFLILRAGGLHPPFGQVYRWTVTSLALSVVTPFQAGEALKVELLRRAGVTDRSEGYAGFLVERAADVFVLALVAAASVALDEELRRSVGPALAAIAAIGAVVLVVLVLVARPRIGGALSALAAPALALVRNVRTAVWLLLVTAACWASIAVGWRACIRSVGVDVGLADALSLAAVVTVATIVSFVPGGFGVSEVGITRLLMRAGTDPIRAQAAALALRGYGLELVVIGLAHLAVWSLLRRSRASAEPAP